MAHENETIVEPVECFINDQRIILRAVVMNAIEKAIQNGMSPEDVTIRPLLGVHLHQAEELMPNMAEAGIQRRGPQWFRYHGAFGGGALPPT